MRKHSSGWILLHRQIMEGKYWLAEPFTKAQAWVDLLLVANHRAGEICKRGIRFEVRRGQVGFSEEALAERWKWSRGKVRRFISELISDNSVERVPAVPKVKKTDIQTVQQNEQKTGQQNKRLSYLISIINYDQYQLSGTTNGTTKRTENSTGTIKYKEVLKKRERRKPLTLPPENFQLTDQIKSYAQKKGYTGDLQNLSEKFLNHHRSKGNRFSDWNAAFRNWILKEVEFNPAGPSAADQPLNGGRTLEDILS